MRRKLKPNIIVWWLTLLCHIWEDLYSNLGLDVLPKVLSHQANFAWQLEKRHNHVFHSSSHMMQLASQKKRRIKSYYDIMHKQSSIMTSFHRAYTFNITLNELYKSLPISYVVMSFLVNWSHILTVFCVHYLFCWDEELC